MITTRQATDKDLDDIIRMGAQLQDESRDYEPHLLFDTQKSYYRYKEELNNSQARIIVAETDDGKLAGYQYSYIQLLDYLEKDNRECVLEALYVEPEYRGNGIATLLIEESERWAGSVMGVERIKTGIYAGNHASEALHDKKGFRPYYSEYIKFIGTAE